MSASQKENHLFNVPQVEMAMRAGLAERIRSECPEIERRSDLTPEAFHEEYVAQSKPVILTGLLNEWNALNTWNIDSFAERFADTQVMIDLYDPSVAREASFTELKESIAAAKPGKPSYLQEWWFQQQCPELLDDVADIPHFADDWSKRIMGFTNMTLWLGSNYSVTPLHQDTIDFNLWTAQITGRKEWIVMSDEAQVSLNADGTPDYNSLFDQPNAHMQHAILEKGDLFYMPHKWFHRTQALSDSISANGTYITEDIMQSYMQSVMSVPLLVALKKEEMQKQNPMRYNVTMMRIQTLAHLIGLDADYIFKASNKAVENDETPKAA